MEEACQWYAIFSRKVAKRVKMPAVLYLYYYVLSRTIWVNVLLSSTMVLCEASLQNEQFHTCNFSELPKIYSNPNSVSAEQNGTDKHWPILFDNCSVDLHLICDASYPVEWVEQYDQDIELLTDYADNIEKHLWTDRIINETLLEHSDTPTLNLINTPEISIFRAELKVIYNTPLCTAANYTCQSISNSCQQSRIVSVADNTTGIIKYTQDSSPKDDLSMEDEISIPCDTTIEIVLIKNEGKLGFKCTGSATKSKVFSRTCDAAVHCNSHLIHYKTNCTVRLPDVDDCEDGQCVYTKYKGKHPRHAGFAWCTDANHNILANAHYFFSVPQSMNSTELPELYLHWDQADPEKMLFFEPILTEIFKGENRTIFCRVSRYYFAYGYRFGLQYRNGTMRYTLSKDGEYDPRQNFDRFNFTLNFDDPTLDRIYCLAPVWNSVVWINQSTEVQVKTDKIEPHFTVNEKGVPVLGDEHEINTFYLHQRNATLSCRGRGRPLPEMKWFFKSKTDVEISEVQVGPGRKDLIFKYVTANASGEYICKATSFVGNATKTFTVEVQDPFANFVQASLIIVSITILIFIVILALCWRKVQRQKSKLRALTDAEVIEFRRGNLRMLENTEYLDTDELLQALPYNDEYEIPSRCLYVDPSEVLGSGNFGVVLKGAVFDRQTRRKSSVVAVKTTKPKFDVNFFQTLLTEVKIMAYIGQHANIVSLIGACTENIKNRQIYIAVEFCANGSLEKVLKNNRSTFINLICGDTIHMTTSFCERDQINAYENTETALELTTIHLLKWSREIANGMDFLGSKKIVHGDLAARNILLTHNNVAKIGDFGLSRVLMKYSNYTRSTQDDCFLAFKWSSPEVLQDFRFSPLADVWSYGVTLWEIFSLAQHPYPGVTYNSGFLEWLKAGHRLHKPYYANSEIYNLIMECWSFEPSNRISFAELKDTFEGFLLQATNGDYVHTKETVTRYVNGSHNHNSLRVHNPGYSLVGENLFFEPDNDENETQTSLLQQAIPTTEDYQGYLRPLKLDFENNLSGCDKVLY